MMNKEQIYLDIRAQLYERYPLAAFGPAHVQMDDENWDYYEFTINACNAVLLYRSCRDFGINFDSVVEGITDDDALHALDLARDVDFYQEHTTEEIAETLAAARLIAWHEEGYQTEEPAAPPY